MDVQYFHHTYGLRQYNAQQALLPAIEHPDAGSEFEALVNRLKGTSEEKMRQLAVLSFEALLAFREDDVTGFLAVRREPFKTHIFSVYVMPLFRNGGVGSALLYHELNHSCQQGVKEIQAGKGKNPGMTLLLRRGMRKYPGPYQLRFFPETGLIQNDGLRVQDVQR